MPEYSSEQLRNVALVGHGASGKTSLASALLYNTKMVSRLGRVEDGNTVTDYDPDEIHHKFSLNLTPCFLHHQKCKINLLDTPGSGDFVAEAMPALRVVESAVVVVSGVSGVEVYTEKVWEWAETLKVPRIVFVNKMDRERASFARTLESLRSHFEGCKFVPMVLPIGEEDHFQGVIDLLTMKAWLYKSGEAAAKKADIPTELLKEATAARAVIMESAAEMEDALLERYLESGDLSAEDMARALRAGIEAGRLFPVFCGSSTKNIGLDLFLDRLIDCAPAPKPLEEAKGKGLAFVFKTIDIPHSGKMSVFRVYSGTLNAESIAYNATAQHDERIGHLNLLQGKEHVPVNKLAAGDIGSVQKLKGTATGDTLCEHGLDMKLPPIAPQPRLMAMAIEPKAKGDEEKISNALKRLGEEDPSLDFHRNEQTKEMIVSGMGQFHLEVSLERLKHKFGVDATLKLPTISYLETISGKGDVHYRHKKQSGGAGQFGECAIRISPNKRGAGFEFVNSIVGGAIPGQFIPSVEKGVVSRMADGVLAGFPVVDVVVELYDGKHHPVDSKDVAFQIAGRQAFKEAALQAHPILLEPIMLMEIVAPEDRAGDIMGNLNGHRGHVVGMESCGKHRQIIRAEVPHAEVQRYAPALQSMTGGRGTFTLTFLKYAQVPAHIQEKIVAEAKGTLIDE